MSDRPIIGIIGGAGVAATNKFNHLLERKITKSEATRDCDHPVVITYQATQVPSRSMYLEGRGESFVPGYIEIANILKKAGATTLCMTCNTAHFAIDEIQASVEVPIVNLVSEVVKVTKKSGYNAVGIMASDGTIQSGLYEKYFQNEYPEAKIIFPSEKMQLELTKGIINTKNSNRFSDVKNVKRPKAILQNL